MSTGMRYKSKLVNPVLTFSSFVQQTVRLYICMASATAMLVVQQDQLLLYCPLSGGNGQDPASLVDRPDPASLTHVSSRLYFTGLLGPALLQDGFSLAWNSSVRHREGLAGSGSSCASAERRAAKRLMEKFQPVLHLLYLLRFADDPK
ncbi:hypothetical protein Q9233_010271 [Columba guinea]|nr:hypothetical protein Q9233_010271 [Columba guinea]